MMAVNLDIKGPIISNDEAWIYDLFEIEATSPKKVHDVLGSADGDDLIVSINSPGGYVDEGSEIYTTLKNYPGYVEIQIVGVAASAASFIAMAGDHIKIAPTARMMIHNASNIAQGDHQLMTKNAQVLQTTDRAIVNAYAIKTGKSVDDLLAMMDEETWMNAQQALEHNFVDEIMFMEDSFKASASYSDSLIPKKVIDVVRNKFIDLKREPTQDLSRFEQSLAELSNKVDSLLNSQQKNQPSPKRKRFF